MTELSVTCKPLHFDVKDPMHQIFIKRAFECQPGAHDLFLASWEDCIGVNFFKQCHVVLLEWPKDLATLLQAVGRSNRVDHKGAMFVTVPKLEVEGLTFMDKYKSLSVEQILGSK